MRADITKDGTLVARDIQISLTRLEVSQALGTQQRHTGLFVIPPHQLQVDRTAVSPGIYAFQFENGRRATASIERVCDTEGYLSAVFLVSFEV